MRTNYGPSAPAGAARRGRGEPDLSGSPPRRPCQSRAQTEPARRNPMTTLRDKLVPGKLLTCPGVFDGISLRLADRMGFECLYLTGSGTVPSPLGLPDAGLEIGRAPCRARVCQDV